MKLKHGNFSVARLADGAAMAPVHANLIARLCDPALADTSPRITLEAGVA